MKVEGIIWLRDVVEKLAGKHNLTTEEVEEAILSVKRFRFIEIGDVEGEDLFAALGRTAAGRYLIVYFVYKRTRDALIVSARNMTKKEKKLYAKK